MSMDPEKPPSSRHASYMRWMLRRYGVGRATLISCALAFLIASLVMIPINLFTGGSLVTGLIVTLVICTTVVPYHSYHIFSLLDQIERAHQALYLTAITDELTSAYNRRHFLSRLQQAARGAGSFAIVLFDIDDFKRVNDTHGHAAGDAVLQMVSRICQEHSRQGDLFARYGGEEFAFLLAAIGPAQAHEFAERIRALIAETPIHYKESLIHCTVSIGVKVVGAPMLSADAALIAADHALYAAKTAGKNRIVMAPDAEARHSMGMRRAADRPFGS